MAASGGRGETENNRTCESNAFYLVSFFFIFLLLNQQVDILNGVCALETIKGEPSGDIRCTQKTNNILCTPFVTVEMYVRIMRTTIDRKMEEIVG